MASSNVTQEDISRFEAAFYGSAAKASGELSVERLQQWLAAMSSPPVPDGVLRDIARRFNSGDINFEQMLELLARSIPSSTSTEDLQAAFNAFDTDKSGTISRAEIRSLLKKLESRPSDQDIEDIVAALDVDGDGEINYAEFVKAMSQ